MKDMQPIHPRLPIEYHLDHIGDQVQFTSSGRGKVRKCNGTITDVQHDYGTIYDMKTGDTWYAIKVKIKPDDGSRAFWTRFADRATDARPTGA